MDTLYTHLYAFPHPKQAALAASPGQTLLLLLVQSVVEGWAQPLDKPRQGPVEDAEEDGTSHVAIHQGITHPIFAECLVGCCI